MEKQEVTGVRLADATGLLPASPVEPVPVSPLRAAIPSAGTPPRKVWPLCGYAPGNYMGKCRDCGEDFVAAKRASLCLDCAVISANARLEISETLTNRLTDQNGRLRIALWNELRRAGVPQDAAIEIVRLAADAPAQAIEARSAKTEGLGPQDESAGPQDCAQGDPS